MSEFEMFYDLGGDYGDGILLQKRGDRYSVVAARKSQKAEGTIKPLWVIPPDKYGEPRKKEEDKYQFIPQGLKLGNRVEAVAFFRWALSQLSVAVPAKPVPQPVKGEDQKIPF